MQTFHVGKICVCRRFCNFFMFDPMAVTQRWTCTPSNIKSCIVPCFKFYRETPNTIVQRHVRKYFAQNCYYIWNVFLFKFYNCFVNLYAIQNTWNEWLIPWIKHNLHIQSQYEWIKSNQTVIYSLLFAVGIDCWVVWYTEKFRWLALCYIWSFW